MFTKLIDMLCCDSHHHNIDRQMRTHGFPQFNGRECNGGFARDEFSVVFFRCHEFGCEAECASPHQRPADRRAEGNEDIGPGQFRLGFGIEGRPFGGIIRARRGQYQDAAEAMCQVAGTGDSDRLTFVVDGRYFTVKDLARLGLAGGLRERLDDRGWLREGPAPTSWAG